MKKNTVKLEIAWELKGKKKLVGIREPKKTLLLTPILKSQIFVEKHVLKAQMMHFQILCILLSKNYLLSHMVAYHQTLKFFRVKHVVSWDKDICISDSTIRRSLFC